MIGLLIACLIDCLHKVLSQNWFACNFYVSSDCSPGTTAAYYIAGPRTQWNEGWYSLFTFLRSDKPFSQGSGWGKQKHECQSDFWAVSDAYLITALWAATFWCLSFAFLFFSKMPDSAFSESHFVECYLLTKGFLLWLMSTAVLSRGVRQLHKWMEGCRAGQLPLQPSVTKKLKRSCLLELLDFASVPVSTSGKGTVELTI